MEKKKESQFSCTKLFKTANQTVIDGYKCVMKKRPHRHILLFSIFLMIFTGMGFNQNTQLYVEKNFGWNLPEYTNYMRFAIAIFYICCRVQVARVRSKPCNLSNCEAGI